MKHIKAVEGQSYPIRLLHLNNGILIIGFVIEIFPEVILVLRPYSVVPDYDMATGNIDGYEFVPYLDQLAHYDPNTLDPTPFVMSSIVSVNVPAEHMIFNYDNIISIKSAAAEDLERIVIRKRTYLNDTVH